MSKHFIDESGKWLVDGNCKMLVEASTEWIQKNVMTEAQIKKLEILSKLAELDTIVTRQVEQLYEDLEVTPKYKPIADAIEKKKELRKALTPIT